MSELAQYNPHLRPMRRSVTAEKLVDADVWATYANIASTVATTEFVPSGLRNKPESILACLLYGHDLGLGPMVALREITMIDGKPALSAALVTARVREAGHRMEWKQLLDSAGEFMGVTAIGERKDGSKGDYTFTLAMAKRAGLMRPNGPYFKYPESMCWARAATQLARMLFSDVFLGHAMYTPEELGAESDEGALDGVVLGEIVAEGSVGDRGETPAAGGEPLKGGAPAPADASPFAKPASVPEQKKPTAPTLTLLNMLVARLTEIGRITKPDIWEFCGKEPDAPADTASFSKLRDRLSMHEASVLVDHLVALEGFAIADGALKPRNVAA